MTMPTLSLPSQPQPLDALEWLQVIDRCDLDDQYPPDPPAEVVAEADALRRLAADGWAGDVADEAVLLAAALQHLALTSYRQGLAAASGAGTGLGCGVCARAA